MASVKEEDVQYCVSLLDSNFLDQDGGWEFFSDSKSQAWGSCKIHRKLRQGSPLYKYFAIGFLNDVLPQTLYDINNDFEYRLKWDTYCLGIDVLEDLPEDNQAMYWNCKFPWPLSNRDYVYFRKATYQREKAVWIQISKGGSHPKKPEVKGTVRVDDLLSMLAIIPKGDSSCEFRMLYADDLKGSIPTSMVNWAVGTAIPTLLKNTREACINFSKKQSVRN